MSRLLDELTNTYNQSESVYNLKNALALAINRIIELEDVQYAQAPESTITVAVDSQIVAELQTISGKLDTLIDIGKYT